MHPLHFARLVVLISGQGSNLQAVLDACSSGLLSAEVAAVFSNNPDAYGLERAKQAGVPAISFPKPGAASRREYDALLAERVREFEPDWILLLGWMRILTSNFLDRFLGRVINLHPALPGAFPGTNAIERAFQAYQRGEITQTGIMLHLVQDENVDCGPVLAQQTIPILPQDTLESLEARIHEAEHLMVVAVMKQLLHRNPS
ncbi:MAG: phosphoribosylglycinamide formyltransferase [Anaerolineae bacterium]|nr:phosphoribosylglycinamide formyltransferase [Anaerolineae bacterium]